MDIQFNTIKRNCTFFISAIAFLFIFMLHSLSSAASIAIFAQNDSASTSKNTPVAIPVLLNDRSAYSSDLNVAEVIDGFHGTVTINDDNTLVYSPDPDFTGVDYFIYQVSDLYGNSDTAWVAVSVGLDTPVSVHSKKLPSTLALSPVAASLSYIQEKSAFPIARATGNPQPVLFAQNDSASTPKNTAVSIPVLVNDFSSNSDVLHVVSASNGKKGTVQIQPDFSDEKGLQVLYTPNEDETGTDNFQYVVGDDFGNTTSASVKINIGTKVPTAVADMASTAMNSSSFEIPVLNNDYDIHNSPLSIIDVYPRETAFGYLNFDNASVTYEPKTGQSGYDTLTYTIQNGSGETDTANVVVIIGKTNDSPPNAKGDIETVFSEVYTTFNPLENDTDPDDSQVLTLDKVSSAANGFAGRNGEVAHYTSFPYFLGSDTITYTVKDSVGNLSTAAVTVSVVPPVETKEPLVHGTVRVYSNFKKTYTLTNTGTIDDLWHIVEVSVEGSDPYDFVITRDECSGKLLDDGQQCDIDVVFSPLSTNNLSASLVIETDDPFRQFTIALEGKGTWTPPFHDSDEIHAINSYWAKHYIYTLFYSGISSGYEDGTYRPSNPVTRAQMAVYIVRAVEGEPTAECTTNPFSDVPAAHVACKYIRRAVDLGIVSGFPDGTYKPSQIVNRGQMAAFIIKGMIADGQLESEPSDCVSDPFPDVPSGHPFCRYINELVHHGIASGFGDGTYKPAQQVDRWQMATFISKGLLNFVEHYKLTIKKSGNGKGTVSGPGLMCNPDCPETSREYNEGNIITLESSTTENFSFNGWSGGPCTGNETACTINSNPREPIIASFSAVTSSFDLTVSISGQGKVHITPPGEDCSAATCLKSYPGGTDVLVAASPDSGWSFKEWQGHCSGTSPSCTVTMNGTKNVTAVFTEQVSTNIEYIPVPLEWNGSKYAGLLYSESIGPKPSQKFYRIDLPSDCTTVLQLWLAGNVGGYVNANMIASDQDFLTPSAALGAYNYLIGQYGYDNDQEVFYNNATYWFNFQTSYEGENFYILSPWNKSVTYYVEVINENNTSGKYNLKAYCW